MKPSPVLQWMLHEPLDSLMARAARLRDARGDRTITFSPKAFLPLTKLCRDACKYCTFAQPPQPGRRAYMTLPEVLAIARAASAAGCTEALLTLGDKPELIYPEAQLELHSMGFETTVEYVRHVCAALLTSTGLVPHVNAGVMTAADLASLREVSASQGLMLETTAAAVAEPGGAHEGCPDKEPAARLRTIELAGAHVTPAAGAATCHGTAIACCASCMQLTPDGVCRTRHRVLTCDVTSAGELRIPFTSGLLVGIGETAGDRLADLLALRLLHVAHGHLQELIIQNFCPKPGTPMAAAAEPCTEEHLRVVAMARLLFGSGMSIQAPPNLTASDSGAAEASWRALLDAGAALLCLACELGRTGTSAGCALIALVQQALGAVQASTTGGASAR